MNKTLHGNVNVSISCIFR